MTARKHPDPKPSTDANISADMVAAAISVLTTFLQTGGAVGNVTGTTAGHSASMTATDQQNKVDVNVPEVLTGLNAHTQERAGTFKDAMDVINLNDARQASFFADLNRNMATDHRDQNHTKQMLAVTFPFVVAGDAAEESAND